MLMMDSSTLSESVKLAVAPVFLLTAVAAMIGALTQRLSRVVDRARWIHREMSSESILAETFELYTQELKDIEKRGRLINTSMVFLVICALLIGMTVMELFLAETVSGQLLLSKLVLYTFVGGIASFILALISLLMEVLVAWYSIRWQPHLTTPKS
jgi:Protein of unknown function (DUF2721)